MTSIRTISFDGIVIGGGGAGMRAALQWHNPDSKPQ